MDFDTAQRVVFGLLLEHHPVMLDMDGLVEGADGEFDAESVVTMLINDGLASRVGHKVGATRAAVRAEQLLARR